MNNLAINYKTHIELKLLNARTILERSGLDSMVIHSGKLKYMFQDDMTYPFKANPMFLESYYDSTGFYEWLFNPKYKVWGVFKYDIKELHNIISLLGKIKKTPVHNKTGEITSTSVGGLFTLILSSLIDSKCTEKFH